MLKMSGEESSGCFACLTQFHQTSSSSSSVLAGSLLFTKFISFARQYLRVDASVSNLSQDQDDLDLCDVCSRRVDSICQLHNELQALEHRLSTKLEELGALMKQSKNGNQNEVLEGKRCATRTKAVRTLRHEIMLKCFEKCELLTRNREFHEKEEQDEDDEAERMELDIKSEVESLQEDSEDGANLDDDVDEEVEKKEYQNHSSLGQTNETENEEEDEREEDSSSDHSFIPSPGDTDSSSSSESNCSDKGRCNSPQKDQPKQNRDPRKEEPASTSSVNNSDEIPRQQPVARKKCKLKKKTKFCRVCRVVIEGPRKVHMRKYHKPNDKKTRVCEVCGASVIGIDAFRHHMYYFHRGPDLICDVCGKVFRLKYNLERHQLVHTGARDFKCHLCPSQFSGNRSLKQHLVRAQGKEKGQEHTPGEGKLKRKCEYPSCNASYLSESDLTSHIEQVHSKNEEGNVWICTLCGKVFANQQRLTRHDLVHNKVKKHTCTVCNMDFTYLHSLKKHVKVIHLKERIPCTQPGCDQLFGSSSNLTMHLRRKHGIFSAKYRAKQGEKLESSHPRDPK